MLKYLEDLEGDITVSREGLLGALKQVLVYALRRVMTRQTPSHQKPKWARIVIQAASVAGSLLKDIQIEDLARRVERLEAVNV